MVVGFVLNFVIGSLAYFLLRRITSDAASRRGDGRRLLRLGLGGDVRHLRGRADGLSIAFNAYMPVMLAVMEIPGCLVALYLVARLRSKGMDPAGNMPDEPGYDPPAGRGRARHGRSPRSWPESSRRRARQGGDHAGEARDVPEPEQHQLGSGKKPARLAGSSCCTRCSSTPGFVCCSAGSSSASSAACRAKR